MHAVTRKNLKITEHTKVCSHHFLENDYCAPSERAAKRRKETSTPKGKLAANAVPSVFSFRVDTADTSGKTSRRPPKDRITARSDDTERTESAANSLERSHIDLEAASAEVEDHLVAREEPPARPSQPDHHDGGYWRERSIALEAENSHLRHSLGEAQKQVMALQEELRSVKSAAHHVFATELPVNMTDSQVVQDSTVVPQGHSFCLDDIAHSDKLVRFYTGLPSLTYFEAVYGFVEDSVDSLVMWNGTRTSTAGTDSVPRPRSLSGRNELLLVLMKLRLDSPYEDLALRFGISVSTVSRLFTTWLMLLYRKFSVVNTWPSRAEVDAAMPPQFTDLYPSTRVVIDCTEFSIEKPSDPDAQRCTWSSYKNRNTFKLLVGASPSGGITFLSSLYGGSVSDNEITLSCGLLDKLDPGDSIMADKGFLLDSHCKSRNITLNEPPRLGKDSQLATADMVETRRIASLRVHVERVMERIENYRILDFFDSHYFGIADAIVFVCAFLSNFQPALVQ